MKHNLLGELSITAAIITLSACSGNQDEPAPSPSTIETPQEIDASNEDTTQPVESLEVPVDTDDAKSATLRSAEAHSHGDAELAIVLEGRFVTVEFDTPLYNVLGFEHSPDTDDQKATVKSAEAILGRGGDLFEFNNDADCVTKADMKTVTLFETSLESHDDHSSDHKHGHEEEGHEEKHDDHHDDETDGHEANEDAHGNDHSDTHKDVILQYEFECQKPKALSNVSVNLFEYFKELSEIDVTYLGPSVQRRIELTPNNNSMDMSQ